jgi:uncharacterized protein (DUF1697 family)
MKRVALLRGINVGPSSRIAMADLRELFVSLGCTSVQTLLQSGNVIFEGDASSTQLEKAIVDRFGYASRVLVLTATEFRAVATANPLEGDDPSKLVITFIEGVPEGLTVPTVAPPELFELTDRALYQWCPDGILKSRVSPKFWRDLGPRATSRNLRTVDKLLALLDA